ncbi:MAG: DUF4412 domain-containing protein [Kiritimatiellae bacterium]|nr:DUF4412 domain-containing protein [Kiritimatiellia bacterium]
MRRILGLTALVVCAFSMAAAAATKPAEQFSADQEMKMDGTTITAKINVDNGNVRSEMPMPDANMPSISIVNKSKRALYIIMPNRMYMEKSLEQDDDLVRSAWANPEHLKPEGTEAVEGVKCEKYRMESDGKTYFFFINAKNGAPVRMVGENSDLQINWKNVKLGPQPADLFEPPAGYTKFGMQGLMKGLFGR